MIHVESPPGTIPFIEINLNIMRSMQVNDRAEVAELCHSLGLHNLTQEEVWVVSLDGDRNIRAVVPVARGGYHEVYVGVPAVLAAVLLTASDRFVLVHNHPSSNLTPSAQDLDLTKNLVAASRTLDMMFEDHIIVGPPNNWLSMRKEGKM
jgi:DNA repair protein RadC